MVDKTWDPTRIIELRDALGLGQKEVAEKIGMSWAAYRTYEKGTHTPGVEALMAMADFYDVSTDYLLGRCDTKEYEGITDVYKDASKVLLRASYEKYLQKKAANAPLCEFEYKSVYPYNLYEAVTGQLPSAPLTQDQVTGLEVAMASLGKRECGMVAARFIHGKNLSQIGEEFGISRERARGLISNALNAFRKRPYFDMIRFGCTETELEKKAQMLRIKREKLAILEEELNSKETKLNRLKAEIGAEQRKAVSGVRLEEVNLSARSYNALFMAGIRTIEDLLEYVEAHKNEPYYGLKSIQNCGTKSAREILALLNDEYGIN